jgi:hypothetical protein
VQGLLAQVARRIGGEDAEAGFAEGAEPMAGIGRGEGVNLFAEALGERGALTGGGDGDLEISAAHDGGIEEVAVGRVVDGVAEDVGGAGGYGDGVIDGLDVGGGDDEEGVVEIGWDEFAGMPGEA